VEGVVVKCFNLYGGTVFNQCCVLHGTLAALDSVVTKLYSHHYKQTKADEKRAVEAREARDNNNHQANNGVDSSIARQVMRVGTVENKTR